VKIQTHKAALIFASVLLLSAGFTQAFAGEALVGSTDLYVIDDVDFEVAATVPLGKWIYNITVSDDGRHAYLGASNGLNVYNISERKFEGLLTDKPAFVVKKDAAGNMLYVLTNEREMLTDGTAEAKPSKIMVHNSRDAGLVRSIELDRLVFDIMIIPENDRLYCLDIIYSELEVRQLTSGALIERIYLGNYGYVNKDDNQGFLWRMIRSKNGERIYIPQGGNEAGLLVVETSSNSVRRIALEHEAKWRAGLLSPNGKKLYLNAVRRLAVIDLAKEVETAWKPLDGPYQGMAIDRSGKKLYMTNPIYETGGSVVILDAGTLEPLGRVVLPDASPFSIAVSR